MSIIAVTDQPFRNVNTQINKMMDQLQKGYYNYTPGEYWTPNVNLYEIEGGYLVCVDLAGVDKEKIDITVEDQVLKLKGKRPVPMIDLSKVTEQASSSETPDLINDTSNPRVRIHLMEIDHGHFSREVELPHDVRQELIAAHHRNGLLWIELPKK